MTLTVDKNISGKCVWLTLTAVVLVPRFPHVWHTRPRQQWKTMIHNSSEIGIVGLLTYFQFLRDSYLLKSGRAWKKKKKVYYFSITSWMPRFFMNISKLHNKIPRKLKARKPVILILKVVALHTDGKRTLPICTLWSQSYELLDEPASPGYACGSQQESKLATELANQGCLLHAPIFQRAWLSYQIHRKDFPPFCTQKWNSRWLPAQLDGFAVYRRPIGINDRFSSCSHREKPFRFMSIAFIGI